MVEEPRRILSAFGYKFEEFDTNKRGTTCCGGGGGFGRNYPDRSISVARRRIEAALELGVKKIVTSCPMCERMLGKAGNGEIEVVDIVKIVC